MNIEVVLAIVVPAATGLVFLAYKHPIAYRKHVYPTLSTSGGLIIVVSWIHNIGVLRAGMYLRDFAPADPATALANRVGFGQAADAAYIPNIFLVGVGVAILLSLLLTQLPRWLDIGDSAEKPESDDKSDEIN